jgi:DNA-directed RNA polymerase subunit RPC12/RpoP
MITEHVFICADCKKPFRWTGDNRRHIPKRCAPCQAKRRAMLQKLRDRSRITPRRVAGLYDVTAKCPKCGRDHITQMTAIPDVKPRVYCPEHEGLRRHSEYEDYEVGRV